MENKGKGNGNMAMEKAKAAVASPAKKVLSIRELVEQSARELGKALPKHMRPERIVRIALTTLRMNPKLYECDPNSFLGALFQCAQLGLEPNIEGQAYIIPYRVRGQAVAQFQLGYKGLVELFWRHQSAVGLTMETVYENDAFDFDLGEGRISHKPLLKGDRGEPYAYYAVAHLGAGGRAIKVMTREDVMVHARRFSKCYDKQNESFIAGTPWREHFDAMAKKTVLIQLMRLLPKSIEIQKALAMDETVKTTVKPDMFEVAPAVEHQDLEPATTVIPADPAKAPKVSPIVSDTEKGADLSPEEKEEISRREREAGQEG